MPQEENLCAGGLRSGQDSSAAGWELNVSELIAHMEQGAFN